jgi:hypothetical protein
MLALTYTAPLRYPPKFRFVEGLHEATAGDFKRFGEKSVINCQRLSPTDALNLCHRRIADLEAKIRTRRDRGQLSDSFEASLEQEQSWANQLSGIRVLKPKTPSRTPKYESLVRDTEIKEVVKLGKTKQGVFYLVYRLQSGWKTCSFVSTVKIIKALTFALEQQGKVGAKITEIIPIADDSFNIRFDYNGAQTSVFKITDISSYLVAWNNSRIPACDQPNLKEQLEAEAVRRGFEFTSILDEDIWCIRVSKNGTYLGGILIEGKTLIVSRAGDRSEIKARFVKGAIALLADAAPKHRRDSVALAVETKEFNESRDRKLADVLSGRKSRGW